MKRKSSRIFVKMIIMTVMALAVVSVGSAALATTSLQFAPDEEQPVGAANNGEFTISKDIHGQRKLAATTYYTLTKDSREKARIQFKVEEGFALLDQEREAYVVSEVKGLKDIRDIVQLDTWIAEYDHKDKMVVLTSKKPAVQMPCHEQSFYVVFVDTHSTLPVEAVIADAVLNAVKLEVNKQRVSLPLKVDTVLLNIGSGYRGDRAVKREFISGKKALGAMRGGLLFGASHADGMSAGSRKLWDDTDLTAALGNSTGVNNALSCMLFRSDMYMMRGTSHSTEISVYLNGDEALRVLGDGNAIVAGARDRDIIAKFKVRTDYLTDYTMGVEDIGLAVGVTIAEENSEYPIKFLKRGEDSPVPALDLLVFADDDGEPGSSSVGWNGLAIALDKENGKIKLSGTPKTAGGATYTLIAKSAQGTIDEVTFNINAWTSGGGGGGCNVGAGIGFAGFLVLAGLALTRKRTRA